MKVLLKKTEKFHNLVNALTCGRLFNTAPFIRVIPTDHCNLQCKYCWQRKTDSYEMGFEEFSSCFKKAKQLKVGIISFLGGEPMLWKPIYDAIALCTKGHVLTDITTNGTFLNQNTIEKLGKAGLDYLNISVDGVKDSGISIKTSVIKNNLVKSLKEAKTEFGMHFRLNSVIYKNNFNDVKALVEFTGENDIQISFGFVVPPIIEMEDSVKSIYFTLQDEKLLKEIIEYILDKKRKGYPVIDPESYYLNIFRFLKREKFWECNYPTRYGWINVTPNGKIRSCTKKMDEMDFDFLELNTNKIIELKKQLRKNVMSCNINCYSNCAYDSYFYTHHKVKMLEKVLSRIK